MARVMLRVCVCVRVCVVWSGACYHHLDLARAHHLYFSVHHVSLGPPCTSKAQW